MFVLIYAGSEFGYRIGKKRDGVPETLRSLIGGIGGATLGLLGLLLGFTLSMAISRWDARHDVIVDEANAIGTLWLRAGLLEPDARDEFRNTISAYLETRIALGDMNASLPELQALRAESEALQPRLWSAVEAANTPGRSPAVLTAVINATNDVIDLHELRLSSVTNHLPPISVITPLSVAIVALAFFGWSFGAVGQKNRSALVMLALLIVLVMSSIMDLNRPQRGWFRVTMAPLERLQASIAATP